VLSMFYKAVTRAQLSFSLILTIGAVSLIQPPAGGAQLAGSSQEAALGQGLKRMKSGDYSGAARVFRAAALDNPDDPFSRYYLANCLVHMKRHPEAIVEYRRSYEIDPFSAVSGFCRQALLAYNVAVPDITRPGQTYKVLDRKSDQHVEDAVSMIRRQVADDKNRNVEYANSRAESALKLGERKATMILEDAEREVQDIMANGTKEYDRRGNLFYHKLREVDQYVVKAKVEEIRRKAKAQAEEVRRDARERSLAHKAWSESRKDSLDGVADNLEKQLVSDKIRKTGVALNPIGTGLYVRNYVTDPKKPVPVVRQSVVRILDHGALPETDYNSGMNPIQSRELEPIEFGEDEKPIKPGWTVRGSRLH